MIAQKVGISSRSDVVVVPRRARDDDWVRLIRQLCHAHPHREWLRRLAPLDDGIPTCWIIDRQHMKSQTLISCEC